MIDYALILTINYVGQEWSLDGNSYNGLTWFSDTPKPTQEELDALWEATQATVAANAQVALDAKESALAKLAALGLTEDEVKALVG
jgi:hypothetical protein